MSWIQPMSTIYFANQVIRATLEPMDTHSSLAGPFALGTFAAGDREFAGLVAGDRVLDLTGSGLPPTTRGLLDRWDQVFPRLEILAAEAGPDWADLADLRVLAP